jgi:hypothetical protein
MEKRNFIPKNRIHFPSEKFAEATEFQSPLKRDEPLSKIKANRTKVGKINPAILSALIILEFMYYFFNLELL